MKRLITAVLTALALCLTACAESADLLEKYGSLEWNGALVCNSDHKTLSFTDGHDAYIDLPLENAEGLWFYADIGSYKGEAGGNVRVSFLDGEGGCVGEYETDTAAPDGSFHRWQLGSENGYIPVPGNAVTVRITLLRGSGDGSPYFRNLSLTAGSAEISGEPPEWTVSGKLELVQVRTSAFQYWSWVAIIAIVPLIMFGTRKMIEKAKNPDKLK